MNEGDTNRMEPVGPPLHPLADDAQERASGAARLYPTDAGESLHESRGERPGERHASAILERSRAPEAEPEDPYEDPDDEEYDEEYEDAGAGFLEKVRDRQGWILAGVAVLVLLVMATRLLGGSGGASPAPSAAPAHKEAQQAPAAASAGPVHDTGVVFGEPEVQQKGGTYYLRAGKIAWKGHLSKTKTGEQLTLVGPSAADFKRAITLPGGSITTGVFGRAEPGKPIVHATFHRVQVGSQVSTSGTYYAVDNSRILVAGDYEDTRRGDTTVRTYTEHAPGSDHYTSYKVSFKAPADVPIPVLVGWKPPAAPDTKATG